MESKHERYKTELNFSLKCPSAASAVSPRLTPSNWRSVESHRWVSWGEAGAAQVTAVTTVMSNTEYWILNTSLQEYQLFRNIRGRLWIVYNLQAKKFGIFIFWCSEINLISGGGPLLSGLLVVFPHCQTRLITLIATQRSRLSSLPSVVVSLWSSQHSALQSS